MFHSLSKDIIQTIYEFDPTYRHIFNEVLESLVTPKMKVLQNFLSSYPYPDTISSQMNLLWQVMKKKTIDYDENYFEIVLVNRMKVIFYVMTKEERDDMDNPTDEYNPMIIRSALHVMEPDHIADFIHCHSETIRMIQEHLNSSEIINQVLYDLLGKEYKHYIKSLQFSGVYDEEIHKYLFKNISKSWNDSYLAYNVYNYRSYLYQNREYTIYWHFLPFPA